METQPGARTPLVDPFGRELEEWLRDAPATRAPYLADLVVPPVTGPVQRPDVAPAPVDATSAAPTQSFAAPEALVAQPADADPADGTTTDVAGTASVAPAEDTAFRRPRGRDRARHVAACAPSFPEPPERLALRFEDLAVEVSASSGRTTIERIVILEDEVRRRDEDLARLAAWEATVAGLDDPEVEGARAFARSVFEDLLADAAREADRRDRAAARRAATGTVPVIAPARAVAAASAAAASTPAAPVAVAPAVPAAPLPALVAATDVADAIDALEPTTADRDAPVRPALSLPAVSPVSANTRPTPLVQPATGPTVVDRAAFAAALTAHAGTTASTPVVLPEAVSVPVEESAAEHEVATQQDEAHVGWWSRLVARLLHAFGRR